MSIKSNPLITKDDGLPTCVYGDWTYDKLYYLNAYLSCFIVAMRKQKWNSINYIDLFSGYGKNRLENGKFILGSPLLALSQKQAFDHYFFSDKDPQCIKILRNRCTSFPEHGNISFLIGDANQLVDQVLTNLELIDSAAEAGRWKYSLNLAFLDPEGLELHWKTVEKLASRRTDLIIYYPQMGITREAPNEYQSTPPTPIDRYFGDTQWRTIFEDFQKREQISLHRALLDHYKNKLKALGYVDLKERIEPLMTNTRDAPLYRLMFASKHPLGEKFWALVNKKLPDGQLRLIE